MKKKEYDDQFDILLNRVTQSNNVYATAEKNFKQELKTQEGLINNSLKEFQNIQHILQHYKLARKEANDHKLKEFNEQIRSLLKEVERKISN